MATIDAAALSAAAKAESQKRLNIYGILNNIKIAGQKTTFPYDGLVPQKIQFGKIATINTLKPIDPKAKPHSAHHGGHRGGQPDSDDHPDTTSHAQPILFYT